MNRIKVSVVMSVYNGEKYLREAVESILSQTFKDFEFIIINDASTDNTSKIVNSFNDQRIRILHNRKRLGLTKSLNKGIRKAQGEYIARMDADDVSLSKRLKEQVKFMDKNPKIGACGTAIKVIGNTQYTFYPPINNDQIKATLLFENCIAHSSAIIRANIFTQDKLYYNTKYLQSQDYNLWVRISKRYQLANLDRILVLHRVHNSQISKRKTSRQKAYAFYVKSSQLKHLGIKVSPRNLGIHQKICTGSSFLTLKELELAEQWLTSLSKQNKERYVYNIDVFNKVLCSYWWRICYASTKLNRGVVKRFFASSLYQPTNITLKQKILIHLRTLL